MGIPQEQAAAAQGMPLLLVLGETKVPTHLGAPMSCKYGHVAFLAKKSLLNQSTDNMVMH